MALDRQSIERRDFPVGRRGYDPDAVDAHLAALADEIEEFKRSARQRSETLASSTSDRVRTIIEAAEMSAAEIQRAAEEEARALREEAGNEVRAAREQAAGQASEHVGRVTEATRVMLKKLESMEREFGALMESLRAGAGRLAADLQALEAELPGVGETGAPPSRPAQGWEPEGWEAGSATPAAPGRPAEEPGADAAPALDADETLETEIGAEAAPAAAAEEPPVPEAAELEGVIGGAAADGEAAGETSRRAETDDTEGARLIALNMALNGTPRDETARYLAENFSLGDVGGLLDEVYASVDG